MDINIIFYCKFCVHKARSVQSHIHHLHLHRNLTKYLFCGLGHCAADFRTESALRYHVIRSHKVYVAQSRLSMFKNVASLHNSNAKFQCPVEICGQQFFIHRTFMSHLKSHLQSGQQIPCPFISVTSCTKKFTSWHSLTGHTSKCHRKETRVHPEAVVQPAVMHSDVNIVEVEQNFSFLDELCDDSVNEEYQETWKEDCSIALAQFYQKLEFKHMVSATVTQLVAIELKTLMMDMQRCFLSNLGVTLESEGVSSEVAADVLLSMSKSTSVLDICNSLRSIYMRRKFYKENFCFVRPIEIPLENGSSFYYIPPDQTLLAAFKNKQWRFFCKAPQPSQDGCLRDFYDGEAFKNNVFFQENPDAIPIILYQDGFQVVCAIGPASNLKHKIIGIYMAFGNLPSEIRFQKESIQLVALCRECDFNHKEVYGRIVTDLLTMQDGINIPNHGVVKAGLAFIAGDNLGSHELAGLNMNFSRSIYFCRYCLIQRKHFHEPGGEVRKFPRRTVQSYSDALKKVVVDAKGNVVKSNKGVKFDSVFNQVKGFHVCSALAPCVGHDACAGVVAYDLKLFIQHFVKKKWFSLDELNDLIENFPYSTEDRRDKPPKIKKLEKPRLAGCAWQVWTLLRLFPLIVHGHVKDPNDPVWQCLLQLRDVVEFIVAPHIHVSHVPSYQCLIDEYLVSRRKLFPKKKLRCKHHYLREYGAQMYYFGPPIKVMTLRFESKHTFFNRSWRSSNNSINVLQTLSNKHEFLQSWVRSGGGVKCEVETRERTPFLRTMYSGLVLNAVKKCSPTLQLDICSDYVSVKGTVYRKGDVVVVKKLSCFSDLLHVGVIHLILIDFHGDVIFLLKTGTASYKYVVGAFKIEISANFECMKQKDLLSYYPLHPYVRDSKTYVCLKHALVSTPFKCP